MVATQNPMRILMLVTDAHGGFGGIAQYNQDVLEALSISSRKLSRFLAVSRKSLSCRVLSEKHRFRYHRALPMISRVLVAVFALLFSASDKQLRVVAST